MFTDRDRPLPVATTDLNQAKADFDVQEAADDS